MISKRQHAYLPSNLLSSGVMQKSDRKLSAFVGFAEAGGFGRPLAVRPCSRGTRHLFGPQRKQHWKQRLNTSRKPHEACFLKSEPTVFSLKLFRQFFLVVIEGDTCVCALVFLGKDKNAASVRGGVHVAPVARGTAGGIVRIIFSLPPY